MGSITSRTKKISAMAVAIGVAALSQMAVAADKGKDAPPLKTPYQMINEAPADHWRPVDPENLLVMDLPSGEIYIELRPDLAPSHVQQIKTLVRRGFYDGLKFHRVIEGFMAQGGDPKGDGTGGSDLPNIPPEFVRDSSVLNGFFVIGRDRVAARIGFLQGMAMAAEPEALRSFRADRRVRAWPVHCPGVMSMARSTNPASANSQFFLMIGDARDSLDQRYSAWGWIIDGFENARRINRGEPPDRPTPVVRARIASDIPESDVPKIEVFDTSKELFEDYLKKLGQLNNDGLVKDICNIKAPRRVAGKVEL